MRSIHDPNEYHKYKSTTGNNNVHNTKGNSNLEPTGLGWVVICILVIF